MTAMQNLRSGFSTSSSQNDLSLNSNCAVDAVSSSSLRPSSSSWARFASRFALALLQRNDPSQSELQTPRVRKQRRSERTPIDVTGEQRANVPSSGRCALSCALHVSRAQTGTKTEKRGHLKFSGLSRTARFAVAFLWLRDLRLRQCSWGDDQCLRTSKRTGVRQQTNAQSQKSLCLCTASLESLCVFSNRAKKSSFYQHTEPITAHERCVQQHMEERNAKKPKKHKKPEKSTKNKKHKRYGRLTVFPCSCVVLQRFLLLWLDLRNALLQTREERKNRMSAKETHK